MSLIGEIPYREGQSVGVIPEGIDKNGKPHKVRLYSIASSALGDFGNSETVIDQFRNKLTKELALFCLVE